MVPTGLDPGAYPQACEQGSALSYKRPSALVHGSKFAKIVELPQEDCLSFPGGQRRSKRGSKNKSATTAKTKVKPINDPM